MSKEPRPPPPPPPATTAVSPLWRDTRVDDDDDDDDGGESGEGTRGHLSPRGGERYEYLVESGAADAFDMNKNRVNKGHFYYLQHIDRKKTKRRQSFEDVLEVIVRLVGVRVCALHVQIRIALNRRDR